MLFIYEKGYANLQSTRAQFLYSFNSLQYRNSTIPYLACKTSVLKKKEIQSFKIWFISLDHIRKNSCGPKSDIEIVIDIATKWSTVRLRHKHSAFNNFVAVSVRK